MKLTRTDGFGIAVVLGVAALLATGTGKGKGKQIPFDERHRPGYDALKQGRLRTEVELLCTTCHSMSAIPLPRNHPPKEQCLICHPTVSS